MFLPHLSLGLLAVGELIVPLGCVLLGEVVCSHLMEGSQLLVLELNGCGKMSSTHLLRLVLVHLPQVEFLQR